MESRGSCEVDLENFEATELRLGLPGTTSGRKRSLDDMKDEGGVRKSCSDEESCQVTSPVAKAQVVGWPPVRSYRKNTIQARKSETENVGFLVKVSMDGAPYLRKIDLKLYKGYKELHQSLFTMFKCFSTGEFVTVYEDKDGDWMLVGDVPWEMFISSCKRLRIMKGSEAIGLGSST